MVDRGLGVVWRREWRETDFRGRRKGGGDGGIVIAFVLRGRVDFISVTLGCVVFCFLVVF